MRIHPASQSLNLERVNFNIEAPESNPALFKSSQMNIYDKQVLIENYQRIVGTRKVHRRFTEEALLS